MSFVCPVCDWPYLAEKPDRNFEICPQCGTEFGNDDYATTHAELRKRWEDGGRKFWSKYPYPENRTLKDTKRWRGEK